MVDESRPSAERRLSYDGGYMDVAREAEELFAEYAREQGFEIIDVREDPEHQENGIDFKLIKHGKQYTVEVKSDKHLDVSGNFLFELMRINHRMAPEGRFKPGWSIRSKAGSLVFYAPETHTLHRVLMAEYRDAANAGMYELRKRVKVIVVPTDEERSTITALIPIEYLTLKPSYKKIELPKEQT